MELVSLLREKWAKKIWIKYIVTIDDIDFCYYGMFLFVFLLFQGRKTKVVMISAK